MSRDIEFRVIAPDNQVYYLNVDSLLYETFSKRDEEELKISQYTGLKDGNWDKIFEDDILHFYAEEVRISVYRDEYQARWSFNEHRMFDDGSGRWNRDLNKKIADQCEVVGNMYQNIYLLSNY